MAKVEKIAAKTEEIKDTFGGEVTITLSQEEAEKLKCILGNITGSGPLREFADSIYWPMADGPNKALSSDYRFSKYVETNMHVTRN